MVRHNGRVTGRVVALVGDVVASRKIAERVAFDAALVETMQARSQANTAVVSPYTLIGDEIQAVYANADFIFHDCAAILATTTPERMRFSFGVGELVKPINPEQATGMDGPAFHHARDGIDRLKHEGHLLSVRGEDIACLDVIGRALDLVSHQMRGWNATRFRTLALLMEGRSVKDIAQALGLSEQAIYKTIRAGALGSVIDLFADAARHINRSL